MNVIPAGQAQYRAMLQKAELFDGGEEHPELRVALFADHAPQQLAKVLSAAILEQQFSPKLFVAEYGTTNLEVFDRNSEAYRFAPEFAVLSLAVQKFRARFYAAKSAAERESLPRSYLSEVMAVADTLIASGIVVVMNNLPLPPQRMFGNFGLLTAQSLYGSVIQYNSLLAEAASTRSNFLLYDMMYIANVAGAAKFLDDRVWHASKYPYSTEYLPDVTRAAARMMAVRKGKGTKVIVLDLDNTLWGGVIGDDGMDGIALGGDAWGEAFQDFQRYILSMRDRGYILAVCSKNTESIALEVFRSHPEMLIKDTDISVFVANWNDKASNIEYIARVLNLGLDSFVFVDDSPFERSLVRTALPQVNVPELPEDVADYSAALEASGLFEATGFTTEDAARNAMYREEALRTTEQLKFGNIDEYLESLDMTIDIGPFRDLDLPRIAQLIQRSNQFNLRTQRLTQKDCEALRESGEVTVAARLTDKFGDYGLIAVIACETRGEDLFIKEFVMSCRVLKRGVEQYLINYLFDRCREFKLRGIRGQYIKSAKNGMVAEFFPSFAFECVRRDGSQTEWYLPLAQYRPGATYIRKSSE